MDAERDVTGKSVGGRRGSGQTSGSFWGCLGGMPVLDRYLLGEMIPPFVAAVGMLSSLGVSLGALVELVREVVVAGLPLRVALGAALLQVPRFFALVMPLATMAGVLFGLGRMSADAEIVALSASGIATWRILVAPLALALAAAVLTLACNELAVPYASDRAKAIVESALTTELHTLQQRRDVIYSEYGPPEDDPGDDTLTDSSGTSHPDKQIQRQTLAPVSHESVKEEALKGGTRSGSRLESGQGKGVERVLRRLWYARKVEGGRMWGLTVMEMDPKGEVRRVVSAEDCVWDLSERAWQLRKGMVVDVSQDGTVRRILQMDTLEVPMPNTGRAASRAAADLHELSRGNIHRLISDLRADLATSANLLPETTTVNRTKGSLKQWWAQGTQSHHLLGSDSGKAAESDRAECLLARRDAAAFSCVVYALMGASATLATAREQRRSGSRATPFLFALASAALYNVLVSLLGTAGVLGYLPPAWSAWLPSLLGLAMAISIFSFPHWHGRLEIDLQRNAPPPLLHAQ